MAYRLPLTSFIQSTPNLAPPPREVVYFTAGCITEIGKLFQHPTCTTFCELSDGLHISSVDYASDFVLCMSTETAYESNLSEIITRYAAQQVPLSDTAAINLRTALHEAITNAIIWGNLGIRTIVDSLESMETFYQHINARLGSEIYKSLPVTIKLRFQKHGFNVSVSDVGKGFQKNPGNAKPKSLFSPAGRGLQLIEACTHSMHHSDQGRTLNMQISYT